MACGMISEAIRDSLPILLWLVPGASGGVESGSVFRDDQAFRMVMRRRGCLGVSRPKMLA